MFAAVISEIGKSGLLRAAINLGNPLLVTGATPAGQPTGVAPSVAQAVAERLGLAVSYVSFARPGEIADTISEDVWDICLIAAEAKRAEAIAFSAPYTEIEATYLVPAGSTFQHVEDVDRPGTRIAVSDRSAYDLYLSRTLNHGELHRRNGLAGAFELFVAEKLEALAGLRPALNENASALGDARVLPGRFTVIQQAIGTKPENHATQAFLNGFVKEARTSGLIARLIEQHRVEGGLQVASGI